MGPFVNLTESGADCSLLVDTVAHENLVNHIEDTVSDGGCVSGVVDDNGDCDNVSVELRSGSTSLEHPVNCLSGNSCWSYGFSDAMDRPNRYHPPFWTYPVSDGVALTNSKNYEEMYGTGEVNGVSYGPAGQIRKEEFGVSELFSNDSDIGSRLIGGDGSEIPSPGGEMLSTSSPGSSGVTCILPNEQKETALTGVSSQTYTADCLDDRYLPSSQDDDEERGHDLMGISLDLPMGESLDGLRKGSSEISFHNPVQGLSTHLPLFFGVAGRSCSNYLSVSENYERCGVSAWTCCSSSIGGSSGLTNNDGRNDIKHDTIFEVNNADIGRFLSSRTSQGRKSNRLTRTRRAARQCRQTVISSTGLGNNVGTTLNIIRGKRSTFCKPARMNIWGELGSLVQMFDQNASTPISNLRSSHCEVGLLGSESKLIKNRGSVKKRGSFGRRKCKKAKNGGSFKGSKRSASANRRRSKVKMEGQAGQKGQQSPVKVDPLGGMCLKPVDAGSLLSSVENPNHVGTGSNSNLEIECMHTAINNQVHETNCLHNLEVPKLVREFADKLEPDECVNEQLDRLVLSEPAGKFRLPLDLDGNSGRPALSRDVSVLDSQLGDKDLKSTVTVEKLTEYTLGDCQCVSPQIEIVVSKEPIVNGHLEPAPFAALGRFNLIPEKATLVSEVAISTCQKTRSKKGKKKEKVKGDQYPSAGPFPLEQNLLNPSGLNKASKPAKNRAVKNVRNINVPKDVSRSASWKASGSDGFSMEISVPDIAEVMVSRENMKLETGTENLALSGQDPIGIAQSGAPMLDGSLPIGKSEGHRLLKNSTIAARKRRSHCRVSAKSRNGSARGKKKEIKDNKLTKSKMDDKLGESCYNDPNYTELSKSVELSKNRDLAEDVLQDEVRFNDGKEVTCGDTSSSFMVAVGGDLGPEKSSKGLESQSLPPRIAWVLCDDCQKWRCIPAELADIIEETNRIWTCKDNTDKAFSDCLIPQEKSNAEINAELNISDEDSPSAQPCFKGSESLQSTSSQQASWMLIRSNLFLHRNRRTQTIDEIMVCQCKLPLDGSMGCGDECLNRMLNIECVQGTCPCGDLCSNQQFQRHKYANFKWFRCGKKGYGLQLQEDVSQGAFLIEYVGEVLDLHTYEARQQEYASRGQKHFYFMTLNGNEVIDACAKGNLGRFINHSCDPNCRTEKWIVNGEVCIGLFSLREMKKGEEVTFDYNYVRVFGAAAKKCVCGSSGCRGYIGGDPSNTEVVKVDSDDEYPEPIMIHEDGSIERFVEEKILHGRLLDVVNLPERDHFEDEKISDSRLQDVALSLEENFVEETITDTNFPAVTIPQGVYLEERIPDTISSDVVSVPHIDICLQATQLKSQPSDSVEDNLKIPKTCPSRTKPPCIPNSIKYGRCKTSKIKATKPKKTVSTSESSHMEGVDAKLNEVKSIKPKKMVPAAQSSRIEGVEEKLNEVLDVEGGISKRKDATKGYLKLLLVTAASGDNVKGEAFQSTRDLSIVLDSLLKTRSRMVLVDIVNKNGLQMLHNIMKQNHRNFNKIPIIRKLLKVLEFLAVKEILTLEHINAPPPCAGMESFRDSIINLMRHKDMQVHQIARRFRDKWIPHTFRNVNFSDRDDSKFSHRSGHWKRFSASSHKHSQGPSAWHTDKVNRSSQIIPITPLDTDKPISQTSPSSIQLGGTSVSTVDMNPAIVTKQRKRKSRWDQPTEMATGTGSQPPQNTERQIETSSLSQVCEVSHNQIMVIQREENYCSAIQTLGEKVTSLQPSTNHHPSSNAALLNPCNNNRKPCFPNPSCREVVMGQPQAKFLSNLPVSYGIPLPLIQQLGTYHQEGGGDGASCHGWVIAPAVPFHPFPPLPPCPPPSSQRKPAEEAEGDYSARNHRTESTMLIASGAKQSDTALNSSRSPELRDRGRWSSGGLGRRFFRQQKWNSEGYERKPPSIRHPNYRVSKGNWKHAGFSCARNVTNGTGSMGQGVPSFRQTTGGDGLHPSEDLGGKNVASNYYQHPPFHQQNH